MGRIAASAGAAQQQHRAMRIGKAQVPGLIKLTTACSRSSGSQRMMGLAASTFRMATVLVYHEDPKGAFFLRMDGCYHGSRV